MNTVFLITGGAGRVITAIPALKKFAKLNPTDDFKVITSAWESLYWSHPLLQNRTYGAQQKGLFDLVIKDNCLISPEPYHLHNYYNQRISLIEAFDECINNTTDHSDLDIPDLYLYSNEIKVMQILIDQVRERTKKPQVLVIQPYGSSAILQDNQVIDPSGRSLRSSDYLKLVKLLSQYYTVIFFGPTELIHPEDTFAINKQTDDLRFFMSAIALCDYFIGCDSVGQHIARAFNKPGTVILGSTFEQNITYPDHFNIVRNSDRQPSYSPIRIGISDSEFAERMNDGIMNLTDEQIENIYNTAIIQIKTSTWQF